MLVPFTQADLSVDRMFGVFNENSMQLVGSINSTLSISTARLELLLNAASSLYARLSDEIATKMLDFGRSVALGVISLAQIVGIGTTVENNAQISITATTITLPSPNISASFALDRKCLWLLC